ncbi:MAG: hypothetical protein R3F43_15575 [bacterium]
MLEALKRKREAAAEQAAAEAAAAAEAVDAEGEPVVPGWCRP